jgi:hypothetical protein
MCKKIKLDKARSFEYISIRKRKDRHEKVDNDTERPTGPGRDILKRAKNN